MGILKLRVSNRARITFGFAALGLAVVGTVGDAAPPPGATASARAFAARVVVPGQPGGTTPLVASPPAAQSAIASFSYPGDGSVVQTGAITVSTAATSAGAKANSSAGSDVSAVSLFRGEITADAVSGRAKAAVDDRSVGADVAGANVVNLVALGQQVQTAPGARVQLADWGYLDVLVQGVDTTAPKGLKAQRSFVTALDLHVTADHGGLPAGTTILVGYAEVAAQASAQPPLVPKPRKPKTSPKTNAPEPVPGFPPIREPPTVTPKLTAGGYVFPVYGPSSFVDTFGAPRGDVSGGWHHGDDIFAPLGAPVLAVAAGTVFSVGWNKVGGNRVWLRDGQGNLFYYAHLSAFTPLAVNGSKVNAGDVLGFVGNTGDAQGTPTHVHFEIHPVGLIGLGYDGAVDPTTYLLAWKHLQDVSFAGGNAWAPQQSLGNAPKPGAILLNATDISIADGLVPGSLERAIRPLVVRGDNFSSKP